MTGTTEDTTITSKGQVTIPKRIRDLLQLEAGEQLQFELADDGELTVRPKRNAMERLRAVRNQLGPLEVDLDELRRQTKREWDGLEDADAA